MRFQHPLIHNWSNRTLSFLNSIVLFLHNKWKIIFIATWSFLFLKTMFATFHSNFSTEPSIQHNHLFNWSTCWILTKLYVFCHLSYDFPSFQLDQVYVLLLFELRLFSSHSLSDLLYGIYVERLEEFFNMSFISFINLLYWHSLRWWVLKRHKYEWNIYW